MVHHDLKILCRCEINQFFRLRRGACKWLLDENVLAVLKGGFGKFEVRPNRGHDCDCIDFIRCNDFGWISRHRDCGMCFLCPRSCGSELVGNC